MATARPSMSGGGSAGAASVLRFMNRLIDTYRGPSVSAYGDLSDVGTLYLTGVQAALAETTQTAYDPATQRPQIIRAITCIVPGWADIRTTDTIQDTFTSWFYMIENLEQEPGLGYYPPRQILTLRMRSGVSVGSD